MDKILELLQGKVFHLPEKMFIFLSGKYTELTAFTISDLQIDTIHCETVCRIITCHREQFYEEEYLQSRISNPATGTIDHLHAEITASTAVRIGKNFGYSGYALELLRAAGHLHDSDRSFPQKIILGEIGVRHDRAAYKEYKKQHAANSTAIAMDMIQKVGSEGYFFPNGFIHDLSYLILRHELGGEKFDGINLLKQSEIEPDLNLNDLTDIITDADSLAYFDANILTNWEECGKDKTILGLKVHYMYNRMTLKAQDELRDSIIFSDSHILGSPSEDGDINNIREVLLEICD